MRRFAMTLMAMLLLSFLLAPLACIKPKDNPLNPTFKDIHATFPPQVFTSTFTVTFTVTHTPTITPTPTQTPVPTDTPTVTNTPV